MRSGGFKAVVEFGDGIEFGRRDEVKGLKRD